MKQGCSFNGAFSFSLSRGVGGTLRSQNLGLCGTQAGNSSQKPKAHTAFNTSVVVNSQTLRVSLVSGHQLLSLRIGLISNMSEPAGIYLHLEPKNMVKKLNMIASCYTNATGKQ